MLMGTAKGIDGPYTKGTYLWVEVENWKRLEAKLVEGPYIHHCVGIHKDVVPVLYEACKYLGIQPDLYDDNEEQVKAYLRGRVRKAAGYEATSKILRPAASGAGDDLPGQNRPYRWGLLRVRHLECAV